jgi:hypothetical protein
MKVFPIKRTKRFPDIQENRVDGQDERTDLRTAWKKIFPGSKEKIDFRAVCKRKYFRAA